MHFCSYFLTYFFFFFFLYACSSAKDVHANFEGSPCSELVRQVLIEGRASDDAFSFNSQLAVRYVQDNVHNLVFAVGCLRRRNEESKMVLFLFHVIFLAGGLSATV